MYSKKVFLEKNSYISDIVSYSIEHANNFRLICFNFSIFITN